VVLVIGVIVFLLMRLVVALGTFVFVAVLLLSLEVVVAQI